MAGDAPRLTIFIAGGYGTFGGRLATLLADDTRLTLVIGGRSKPKAETFLATLPPGAQRRAAAFDRNGDIATVLAAERPDVVVDCTGPFQNYGDDAYRLVRGTIAQGCHYLDLADGPAFVEGINRFEAEAAARGVFVLSGVSSFPVLTAAALRAISGDLTTIERVTGGIAPSPFAGVGLNVIRAIAGYAGQPTPLWRHGRMETGYPLTETLRYTVAPPGRLPLHNTRFSLVEVPDLVLVPAEHPGMREFWIGAGPVPEIWHRALNALAWSVRLKILPTLAPIAPLCLWAINTLRWGEHRGGMFVEVTGRTADGAPACRSWHLLAEGDDGPLVPSMAIAVIILKMLDGETPAPGARAATRALELGDYDRLFAGRTIVTGFRDEAAMAGAPLYRQLLGDAWDDLAPTLRALHHLEEHSVWSGRATVRNGQGLLASLTRRFIRLPGRRQRYSSDSDVRCGEWRRSMATPLRHARVPQHAATWHGPQRAPAGRDVRSGIGGAGACGRRGTIAAGVAALVDFRPAAAAIPRAAQPSRGVRERRPVSFPRSAEPSVDRLRHEL